MAKNILPKDFFKTARSKEGLSEYEIGEFVKMLRIFNYIGKFNIDTLPKDPVDIKKLRDTSGSKSFCLILNSSCRQNAGEHWQAIWADVSIGCIYLEFFDPFGLPPVQKETIDFITDVGTTAVYLDKPIQDMTDKTSIGCGYHCLFWLWAKSCDSWTSYSTHIWVNYPKKGKDLKLNDNTVILLLENLRRTGDMSRMRALKKNLLDVNDWDF